MFYNEAIRKIKRLSNAINVQRDKVNVIIITLKIE
jgi:hypothetical protein